MYDEAAKQEIGDTAMFLCSYMVGNVWCPTINKWRRMTKATQATASRVDDLSPEVLLRLRKVVRGRLLFNIKTVHTEDDLERKL